MTGSIQSIAHLLKQVALVGDKDPDGVGMAEEGVEVVVAEQHAQLIWPQTLQRLAALQMVLLGYLMLTGTRETSLAAEE